jgi:hypothetical protein
VYWVLWAAGELDAARIYIILYIGVLGSAGIYWAYIGRCRCIVYYRYIGYCMLAAGILCAAIVLGDADILLLCTVILGSNFLFVVICNGIVGAACRLRAYCVLRAYRRCAGILLRVTTGILGVSSIQALWVYFCGYMWRCMLAAGILGVSSIQARWVYVLHVGYGKIGCFEHTASLGICAACWLRAYWVFRAYRLFAGYIVADICGAACRLRINWVLRAYRLFGYILYYTLTQYTILHSYRVRWPTPRGRRTHADVVRTRTGVRTTYASAHFLLIKRP